MVKVKIPQIACQKVLNSVRVYAVIISKYATKSLVCKKDEWLASMEKERSKAVDFQHI